MARLALAAMSCLGAGATPTPAAALSHEEWISAFVRFVEWPVPLSVINGPFVVCQNLGSPGLTLDGIQVRGLTLMVRRIARVTQLPGCHIFAEFTEDEASWSSWLKTANSLNTANRQKARPFILMVGRGGQFCDLGGAICLVRDAATGAENYRLNLETLSRTGFRVDTQLLRSPTSRPAKAE